MGIKPTHEDLKQRVKALEKLEEGLNREERPLISRYTLFRAITEQAGEGISLADSGGKYVFKEGVIRWVEDRKTSLFSEKGEFKGIDGIVFDITDRKKMEEALQESEMTTKALLNASPETAFLIEADGIYVDMNELIILLDKVSIDKKAGIIEKPSLAK